MDMLVRFQDCGRAARERQEVRAVGRKAWRLAAMRRGGFSIPDGFAITTVGYETFLEQEDLEKRILAQLATLDGSQARVQEVAATVQQMMLETPLPEELADSVRTTYRTLGSVSVAVRSSSLHEDARNHTFAGQHTTFLGVSGIDALLGRIRDCFASLFEARAISYRDQIDLPLPQSEARMAVVVQQMVDARTAGVIFTCNPVTAARDEMMIEAVEGLGETLVDGSSRPERIVLDQANGRVRARWPAHQHDGMFLTPDGVEIRPVQSGRDVLTEPERQTLFETATRLQSFFGGKAQDVEWAIGEQLWVVQSRDVAANRGLYEGVDWQSKITRPYGVQYAEISLRALSPEAAEVVPHTFYDQIYAPKPPNEVCYIGERSWDRLERAAAGYLDAPERLKQLEREFFLAADAYEKYGTLLVEEDLKQLNDSELLARYRGYQARAVRYCAYIWLTYIVNDLLGVRIEQLVGRQITDSTEAALVIGALVEPSEKSAVHQRRHLAPTVDLSDRAQIAKLFQRFRWLPCLDLHNQPASLESFSEVIASEAKGRTAEGTGLSREEALGRLQPSKATLRLFELARRFAFIKDVRDDYRRRGVYQAQRSLFREIARRMDLPLDDLSFLQEREITTFLETGAVPTTAAERREGFLLFFDADRRLTCLSGREAQMWLSRSGPVERPSEEGEAPIAGVAACHGQARGRVSVVRGVEDLRKVSDGEVLVAVTTNPDYVATMQSVAAVVTDEGGLLSHAAVVARDCGIPCVVGTAEATERLRDGDDVFVDAFKGIIQILEPAQPAAFS